MKKTKLLLCSLAALLSFGFLTGCGSSKTSTDTALEEKYSVYITNGGTLTFEEWKVAIVDGNLSTKKEVNTLYNGIADPTNDIGDDGDLYINTTSWDIFTKNNGVWSKTGNIQGKDGTITYNGKGIPATSLGKNGDYYIDSNTWNFYYKNNDVWMNAGSLKGADGVNGEDGQDGQDGVSIVSVTKTDSTGLVDTYTITYSDETTSTFQVTNGKEPTIEIGANNHWIIDGVDTGKSAVGKDGEKGEDGQDGKSVYETYKEYHPEYEGDEEQFLNDLINGDLNPDTEAQTGLVFSRVNNDGYYVTGYVPNIASGESSPTSIVIPETYHGIPVVGVASYAFYGMTYITSITLPLNLKYIGSHAFDWVSFNEYIIVPKNVEIINIEAFANLTNCKVLLEKASVPTTYGAYGLEWILNSCVGYALYKNTSGGVPGGYWCYEDEEHREGVHIWEV